jgi:membrane-associated protein
MDFLRSAADLFLHLDTHLSSVIATYGTGTYLILFLIVFCETGLVVTPFLPGDSLLFAAGTFAAVGSLKLGILMPLLWCAALLGDNVNYWFGRTVGPKVFRAEKSRLFNKKHLERTQNFYAVHGPKTVIIARFVPIVRTFAPFVAGIGHMHYLTFLGYSVAGATLWVGLLTTAGMLFGNIPVVKNHFEIVILGIIFVSILPGIIHFAKEKWGKAKRAA